MPPVFSDLTNSSSTTDATTFVTASVTPALGTLVLIAFCHSFTPNHDASSVAGASISGATKVNSVNFAATARTTEIWAAIGTGSPGAITITFPDTDTGCAWSVVQVTNINTATGINGVVQSAVLAAGAATTYGPAVLAAFASVNNPTFAAVGLNVNAAVTEKSGFTELADVGWATPAGRVEVQYIATNVTSVTATGSSASSGLIACELAAASSAIAVGTATETDTALPVGRRKTRAVGTTTETDTALALGHAKSHALGVATETDTAGVLGRRKAKALGVATETDQALPVIHGHFLTVGIAVEVDTAVALGRRKTRLLGIAVETDTARPVGRKKSRLVGIAIETDTARPIGHTKRRLIGIALEVDTALAITRAVPVILGITVRPSVEDILNGTVSVLRAESFRYDAYDANGTLIGPIAVDQTSPPTITNAIRNATRRTMSGMVIEPRPPGIAPDATDDRGLPWLYAEDINSLTMRVKVWWELANTGDELPCGVFLFSDDNLEIRSEGSPRHCSFDDQCQLLLAELPENFGFAAGTNVGENLAICFGIAGVTDFAIDPTTVTLSGPLGYTIDRDTLMTAFDQLCILAGFLPVYFNNNGRGICRAAPDIQNTTPSFAYGPDAMMTARSIVESKNLLKIPNRWRVLGTDATTTPLVGKYDIPADSPNSITNRNRVIAKTVRMPGLLDQASADAAAKALYVSSPVKFATVSWSTPIDPRHDTLDVVGYGEVNYMQVSTSFQCQRAAPMKHEANGSLVPA